MCRRLSQLETLSHRQLKGKRNVGDRKIVTFDSFISTQPKPQKLIKNHIQKGLNLRIYLPKKRLTRRTLIKERKQNRRAEQ